MKLGAYSIFDKLADVYFKPFFVGQDGEAHRMFIDLVNDEKTVLNRHPQDYSLYRIGEFNDNSGELIKTTPKHLANATTVLRKLTNKFNIDELVKENDKELINLTEVNNEAKAKS